jgi:hypothetical protein
MLRQLTLLALLAAAPTTALAQTSAALFDGFNTPVNKGGWSYNPGDTWEVAGGNPGGWWHQPVADTFAPIIVATNAALTGDFRAKGVTQLSFDAQLLGVDFGTGNGMNMSVLLRDTKGTGTPSDDDYAYFVGPNIPLLGQGWKHFDFAIPSADTSAVPTGWTGGWSGDSTQFRPGVTWNDVITSVDRVEIQWIDPSFFAIFQQWNIGLDNIAMYATGAATVRNGGGGNPVSYATASAPALGSVWSATIDIATPGHVLSVLAVSNMGTASGIFPGGGIVGELLVQPSFYSVSVSAGSHGFAVPSQPSLLGLKMATQGATVDAGGQVFLANALDLVIGA